MNNVIVLPVWKNDSVWRKGQDNVILAQLTGRSKFGIKSNTLHEFSDDFTAVERCLIKYSNGWRWNSRYGMVFGQYFHDVKFISQEDAIKYEKYLREEFKKEKGEK